MSCCFPWLNPTTTSATTADKYEVSEDSPLQKNDPPKHRLHQFCCPNMSTDNYRTTVKCTTSFCCLFTCCGCTGTGFGLAYPLYYQYLSASLKPVAQGLFWGGLVCTTCVLTAGRCVMPALEDDTEIALENNENGESKKKRDGGEAVIRASAEIGLSIAF